MPVSGSCCIDTSVAIPFLNGERELLERFTQLQIWMPPVVAGELLYGAAKSSRTAENTAKVKAFVDDCPLLGWSLAVAEQYATTKAVLKREGRPIPENDLWIAAFAIAYDLPLATRDEHFALVDGLDLQRW